MFCDQYYNSKDLYPKYNIVTVGVSLATSFLNQSKIKPKPIMTSSYTVSYSWHWLPSSDWLIVLTVCAVIGQVIIILLWFWFYDTQMKTDL